MKEKNKNIDKKETELRKVYHRVKDLITKTDIEGIGVRINEFEQVDSLTLYDGGVLVVHIDYNTEKNKFKITGFNNYNEEINKTVENIADLSDYIETVLFEI